MFKQMKLWAIVALMALILAACAPAAAPATESNSNANENVAAPTEAATTAATEAATQASTEGATEAATEAATQVATPTIPPPVETGGEGCDPNATKITWFIGLGTGSNPNFIQPEEDWVNNYNKSQKDACILLNIVYNTGQNSYDALRALIAAGNAPDIVGPVGKAGRASFQGAWADITPLAKNANFNLSNYDPKLLEFTKDEGVLVGIPFALFPSFIFYNKGLFDEAGLPYPPHKVGEKYDGKDWDQDALKDLAMKLTVDANGNDATSADFDPANVTQFGYYEQWTDARGIGSLYGGAIPCEDPCAQTKKAVIPDSYVKAWKWYYDGIWKYHFMPTADYANSDQFNKGNLFPSGNVAMSHVHTWYLGQLDNSPLSWDIAVLPTFDGKTTAKLHGDTFAIMKDSKHQDVAFKVLTDMATDPTLAVLYGGMPAVEAQRADFFKALDAHTGANKIDWTVAEEMLKYPDVPNHEAWLPNLPKANALLGDFRTAMDTTPDLNLDEAIAKLQSDLQAAYDAAP